VVSGDLERERLLRVARASASASASASKKWVVGCGEWGVGSGEWGVGSGEGCNGFWVLGFG